MLFYFSSNGFQYQYKESVYNRPSDARSHIGTKHGINWRAKESDKTPLENAKQRKTTLF